MIVKSNEEIHSVGSSLQYIQINRNNINTVKEFIGNRCEDVVEGGDLFIVSKNNSCTVLYLTDAHGNKISADLGDIIIKTNTDDILLISSEIMPLYGDRTDTIINMPEPALSTLVTIVPTLDKL